MAATEESEHVLPDGAKVYTKSWTPSSKPPIALLVFIHGFSDHINSYYTLFPALAARGIRVCGFDQRGWGRSVTSPANRGLTGPTTTVLSDMTSFIQAQLKENDGKVPVFLMGHSMGGGQVLHYAARGPSKLDPSRLTVIAGRLTAKILPRRQMVQKLDSRAVSRDPDVCKEYDADELCHDTGTLEGLAGMLQRAEELERGEVKVVDSQGMSIWACHGTSDKICSFEAAQNLMERMDVTDKTFRVYDGWYHKLHAEPGDDKITFANEVADWILQRAGQNAAQQNDVQEGKSKL